MENKLRMYRKRDKITQQELAEMVDVSSRTIISLEKGQYNPSIMLAYKTAKIFKTTIEDLYCLDENFQKEKKHYENL